MLNNEILCILAKFLIPACLGQEQQVHKRCFTKGYNKMDGNVFGFVSILVFGCGLYGLYAYIMMKKDGHINETLLLGKSYMEHMCQNREEFVKKSLPAVLIFGIAATVYGAIDMIHWFVTPIPVLDYIGLAVFLVILVWYMVYTSKLKKQYF